MTRFPGAWLAGLCLAFAGHAHGDHSAATLSANNGSPWFPSVWGPSDEIGAANRLTPDKVLAAKDLIRTGKTYSLGITVGADTPAYGAVRRCSVYVVAGRMGASKGAGPNELISNDDMLNCWNGVGTQLDGLGHIGIGEHYYNGHKWGDITAIDGLKKLGTDKVPPMVTRAVLLDMAALFGQNPVKEGTAFNRPEIDAALKRQNVSIREGDVVLFHTGWLDVAATDPKRYSTVEPGLGREGAHYLASKGVVAVGADSNALEVMPFESGAGAFEVHQILLARNGIYILENIQTRELAKDGVSEFLFVLGQSKYKGAVQTMINPIGIR
ncbi:polyketide cyclase [Comamonas serinivorans]|uniref:Polyketide cyclase n=1 Tax=Comamonas serinivorans TaxID=1082851 RepID=A0A1Y0EPN6_9BURK|nr:cyclase family protein [Comamonas serinivorans]ARU05593.1 polyketide cyclase [Comamonas serinivorans]